MADRYTNLKEYQYDVVDITGNQTKPVTVLESFATINKTDILSDSDTYHKVTVGDRFDLLAYEHYDNESLWFVIMIANDMSLPTDLKVGQLLRIPNLTQNKIQQIITRSQRKPE